MSTAYAITESTTFTITHAKHMAAKVATDLKRLQRFYGFPSNLEISDFEDEIIELLKAGYLGTATYGFRYDGDWIEPTLRYTANDFADSYAVSDDPGRVRPGADISGASFHSYVTYSSSWNELSFDEKAAFKNNRLPFVRTGADEPGINGYLNHDRTYSAGGRSIERSSVRSYR